MRSHVLGGGLGTLYNASCEDPLNRLTDTCENITFLQLRWRVVNLVGDRDAFNPPIHSLFLNCHITCRYEMSCVSNVG